MPGLIFLPHIFDVYTRWDGSWGVWCSMPLSDLLASVVAFCMLAYQLRKFRPRWMRPGNEQSRIIRDYER